MSDHTITLKYEDEDGEEIELELPSKKEVCPSCEGHGTQLHSALRGVAYTSEEFEECFPEDEDKSEYFRHGGRYDVTCEECHGDNVVKVVDESRLTEEQKAQYQVYQEYAERRAQIESDMAEEAAAERRMGC